MAFHILICGDDVQRIAHAAADGQKIAYVHAQILAQRYEAHTGYADKRRAYIISVRPFFPEPPRHKRHHNAVGGGEKRVFARGGIHKAVGLDNI